MGARVYVPPSIPLLGAAAVLTRRGWVGGRRACLSTVRRPPGHSSASAVPSRALGTALPPSELHERSCPLQLIRRLMTIACPRNSVRTAEPKEEHPSQSFYNCTHVFGDDFPGNSVGKVANTRPFRERGFVRDMYRRQCPQPLLCTSPARPNSADNRVLRPSISVLIRREGGTPASRSRAVRRSSPSCSSAEVREGTAMTRSVD